MRAQINIRKEPTNLYSQLISCPIVDIEGRKVLLSNNMPVALIYYTALVMEIASEIGTTPEAMFCGDRKRENVTARQMFMSLIASYGHKKTLAKIGELSRCQNRNPYDHATVLHAIKTVNNLCDVDKTFRNSFDNIKAKIENNVIPVK